MTEHRTPDEQTQDECRGMTFAEALTYAKRLHEDVNIMEDGEGAFHVIRLFGVEHWSQHYKTVTEVRMIYQITGREE